MDLTEELFRELVFSLYNTYIIKYQDHELDFSKPFRRVPIAQLVAEHLGLEVSALVNINSVKHALEVSLGHLVSNEEPLAICFAELSCDEMNSILPFCFSDEAASETINIGVITKKLAKKLDHKELLLIGEALDHAFKDFPELCWCLAGN